MSEHSGQSHEDLEAYRRLRGFERHAKSSAHIARRLQNHGDSVEFEEDIEDEEEGTTNQSNLTEEEKNARFERCRARVARKWEREGKDNVGGDEALAQALNKLSSELAELHGETGIDMDTVAQTETYAGDLRVSMSELEEQIGVEGLESARKETQTALFRFMRKILRLNRKRNVLANTRDQVIKALHASGRKEDARLWKTVSDAEAVIHKIDESIRRESRENPVNFEAYWLMKIRGNKRRFNEAGIIETEWIREKKESLMNDARRKLEGTNGVVALLGPTGSGNTVTARDIAKQVSRDGKYEFISAHPKMIPDDLIERMSITVSTTEATDVPRMIADAQKRFNAENPDMESHSKTQAMDQIKNLIIARESQKVLETRKVLEAVGRAAKEGRVVVIDEFNYLPPDTLASLNDLLSGGGAEGFGIIFTGNVGEEYLKRQGLDPALINRILSGTIEYDFPPQEFDKSFDNSILSNEKLLTGDKPAERNLMEIAVTQLADERANVIAPETAMDDMWNLSRVFALAQNISGGKSLRELRLGGGTTSGVTAFKFDKVFLTFRNFNQVVREWKLGGYRESLSDLIMRDIIKPAAVYNKREAAQLYYLFHDFGEFFRGDKWGQIKIDTTDWKIAGLNSVKSLPEQQVKLKAFLPAEIVRAVSGMELPEISKDGFADVNSRESNARREHEMGKMESDIATVKADEKKEFSLEIFETELCAVTN